MNLLHTIGLMTRAEHEADCDLCKNTRVVQDAVDSQSYPETAPCPKCRDGYWALKAARDWHAKFKRAATDLAAQAELVSHYESALGFSFDGPCPICGGIEGCSHCRTERIGAAISRAASHEYAALEAEIASLRPDALAMRKKRAADRKRMAGKRGKGQ